METNPQRAEQLSKVTAVEKLKKELLGELQLMRPSDLRAYWKQVNWPKPNFVELAKSNTGPLAIVLKTLSPGILTEASKLLDPFGWLLDAVDVTEWSKYCSTHRAPWLTRIWLAVASQMRAECRLIHKAHGWADTWQELRQNQNMPDKLRYADEFYFAQLTHANEKRRAELLAIPVLEERLMKARQENDEAFLRRFRRAKQGAGLRAGVCLAEKYVVQHWLELPLGFPGLCFFGDMALHSLLEAFHLNTGDTYATKQIRVRLGLIQAGAKSHLIEEVIDQPGKLSFTGRMVRKDYVFKGRVFWGGRQLWSHVH